jgi:hypothetical protein
MPAGARSRPESLYSEANNKVSMIALAMGRRSWPTKGSGGLPRWRHDGKELY